MVRRDEENPLLTAEPLAPGAVLAGKYRVQGVVGRGGMSVVYRATHTELDAEVAIKVLSPAGLSMQDSVARLKREARAASRIRSEHVARVLDIGALPAEGARGVVPYLVMEYLVGSDLAAVLLTRGPLPVDLAVECIMQACEPLAEAHALGIVHRDLKPANLFLTESVDGSPCVKVLDFGISRTIRRSPLAPVTDPGTVLGTPSYMAPEQMEGSEALDARADIWALGAILFELLAGRPAYTGESLPQIFMKIMRSKTPRASASRLDVPPALDDVIARCLTIDPERRFRTVGELAWELSAIGSARTRDSAERISRVLDRLERRVSSDPEASDGAVSLGPMARSSPASRVSGVRRRVVAAFASAFVLGGAGTAAVVAALGARAAAAELARVEGPPPAAATAPVAEAVTMAPRVRPSSDAAPSSSSAVAASAASSAKRALPEPHRDDRSSAQ